MLDKLDKIKDTIQDCNINFLIGSGLSRPFLPTLGDIEGLLTAVEDRAGIGEDVRGLIRASLYKKYFDGVIRNNIQILNADPAAQAVLEEYYSFLQVINLVLLKRPATLLSKEVNLFTTNIDIFLEKALEDMSLEYNDGFNGRFRPRFSLSNFKKTRSKKSLHYDNTAELPVFNLLKLHGSVSWNIEGRDVVFSRELNHVEEVAKKIITPGHIVAIPNGTTVDALITAAAGQTADASTQAFIEAYEKLLIVVNPTKEKFKHTLMNQTYYELLRLYSNELEKENTILFVMGFSFADEHIRDITLRAADSNPTLMIYIVAHSSKGGAEIMSRFGGQANIKNKNIELIVPEQQKAADGTMGDKFQYDFSTINKEIFNPLLERVDAGGGALDEDIFIEPSDAQPHE